MPTFVLIGHCGPDSHLLKNAIARAVPGASIVYADDDRALEQQLKPDRVLLVNRVLDMSDFDINSGIKLIERIRASHPDMRTMLISNYADAQEQAVAVGALQGFGKKAVNSAQAADVLRAAAHGAADPTAKSSIKPD